MHNLVQASVSIIIPTYNVSQYLRECMDSVINQTLQNIEIVCVNDGSTDNSLAILQEYAARDPRIVIVDKPNSGYGDSMNVGIDRATGEYIGIVEPDDYIALDMYEVLYSKARELNLDLIKADFNRFTGKGDDVQLTYNQLCEDDSYYNRIVNAKEDLTPFSFIMNTWSGIYKRDFLNQYGIRHNTTPGASFQDNGFWFQTFCLAERMYFLHSPFYMYRCDNPSSSFKDKGKVFLMQQEYNFIRNFLEKNPQLKVKFLGMYFYKKYNSYIFTYNRIADEFKLLFLQQAFVPEFKQAQKDGDLDLTLFSKREAKTLHRILSSPEKYYRSSKNKVLFEKLFSIRKSHDKKYKILTILGLQLRYKNVHSV